MIIKCFFGFVIIFVWLRSAHTQVILNKTNAEKLICHSCYSNDCETVTSEDSNIVLCNRNTQLCWAGFIDKKPYRACASRYCTPAGISLDSDVRIETCCHSNLCNSVPLDSSILGIWYRKVATTTTPKPTESKTEKQIPSVFVVNQVVDGLEIESEKPDGSNIIDSSVNISDPSSFGINWESVPYTTDFASQTVSISKSFIFLILVFFVFIF